MSGETSTAAGGPVGAPQGVAGSGDGSDDGEDPAIESGRMREVLGHVPTSVVVITAPGDPQPAGLAIGSFTSVSLDPPLVGFFVGNSSSTWPSIEAAGRFCVNVLGEHQESVCRVFATKGADRFAEVGWQPAPSGAPVLDEAVAWIDCRIAQVVPAGDHQLVLGRVLDLGARPETRPLVFHRGGYRRVV
jgi:3-hydroxy-9,10-secoandrosta-1,3,5(10)-triene-9,17-dione monooxygenase reductase component